MKVTDTRFLYPISDFDKSFFERYGSLFASLQFRPIVLLEGVNMEIFSSDSDSDLEVVAQLSEWDSSDSEQERAVSSKTFQRINFMASLTDAEFTFRFRINKASVESVLNEIMPYIKVKSRRYVFLCSNCFKM